MGAKDIRVLNVRDRIHGVMGHHMIAGGSSGESP